MGRVPPLLSPPREDEASGRVAWGEASAGRRGPRHLEPGGSAPFPALDGGVWESSLHWIPRASRRGRGKPRAGGRRRRQGRRDWGSDGGQGRGGGRKDAGYCGAPRGFPAQRLRGRPAQDGIGAPAPPRRSSRPNPCGPNPPASRPPRRSALQLPSLPPPPSRLRSRRPRPSGRSQPVTKS